MQTLTRTATASTGQVDADPHGCDGAVVVPEASGAGVTGDAVAQLEAVAARVIGLTRDGGADHDLPGGHRLHLTGRVLSAIDRLQAAATELLAGATVSDVIAGTGVTPGSYLRKFAGRTVADEKMLAVTVDRLAHMPTVRGWFADGTMSWPTVRGIVAAARNLTAAQRRWLDAQLAARADQLLRMDADDRVAAVQRLADGARVDLFDAHADRAFQDRQLWFQPSFDGSATAFIRFDPEGAATARTALDSYRNAMAAARKRAGTDGGGPRDAHRHIPRPVEQHDSTHHSDPQHGGDAHDHERHERAARRRTDDYDALMALLRQRIVTTTANGTPYDAETDDGDPDGGHDPDTAGTGADTTTVPTRTPTGEDVPTPTGEAQHPQRWAPRAGIPTMIITADVEYLLSRAGDIPTGTAQVLTRVAGGPVELTVAAAQRLACNARYQWVFTDGTRIVGMTAAEPAVSAPLQRLLYARDGHCRFPGCHQPPDLCDIHHVVPRYDNGPTQDDNLAVICPQHHHSIHEGGWTAHMLDPTGAMAFTRRGTTLTTQPRATRYLRSTATPPGGRPRRHAPHPATGHADRDRPPMARGHPTDQPRAALPF